jgi:glycosyltransferase involved in cell wall biosynthesis
MITYNQESYIEKAIESVLMQKTNFPIELVIGEDCSTDRTREICMQYRENHPDIIKLRLPEKNMGMIPNFIENLLACTGKYIAICEGDDYWTDRDKLQKQVDFLESHEECSFCFHNAEVYYCNTGLSRHFNIKLKTGLYSTKDFLLKGCIIPTASILFRKKYLPNPIPGWFYSVITGDVALELLLSTHGDYYYMDEIMCVYRKNAINSLSLNLPDLVFYQKTLLNLYTNFFRNNYNNKPFLALYKLSCLRYDLFKLIIYARYPILEDLKNRVFNKH